MFADRWFKIGLVGTLIAAVCCFTPLVVLALGALGLGAYAIWLDAVLVPALIVFGGILVAAVIRAVQAKA